MSWCNLTLSSGRGTGDARFVRKAHCAVRAMHGRRSKVRCTLSLKCRVERLISRGV